MKEILLLCIASFIPSTLAGTAFCSFEHTSRYQSDLISDEITGYMCKLNLDVKGERVNEIHGGHDGGERDTHVDIIKVIPDYYSYLTTFPKTICNRFTKLEIIDMCRAEIKTIEADSLENCKDLRILQFYMNQFEQVPEELLIENKKLLKIFITFNENLKSLPENLFVGLVELKLLDLSYNKIDHLPPGIFDDLISLKEINLEGNFFIDPETGLFDKSDQLEVLNLNGNGISELAAGVFSGLTGLNTLHLQNNKITIVHADAFPQAANFDVVVLSKNKITAIDELFIDNCGVSSIKMGGNICEKSGLIKKKDIKTKLTKCFENYGDINRSLPERPVTPQRTTPQRSNRSRPTLPTTTTTTIAIRTKPAPTSKAKTKKLQPLYENCGVSKVFTQNQIEGIEVIKGSHPWIAALIHKTEGYFCGGTLYTKRFVVTAANCIKSKTSEKKTSDISVLLGVHDLDNLNELGRKTYSVDSIHIHNQFNPIETGNLDADIAILKLSLDVEFGTWIQPVCIAKVSATLKNFNEGVVVGFGKNEKYGSHENVPMKIKMPIKTTEDCYAEFPSLNKIASYRTFCAGYGNRTGACTGDNGGGMTVVEDGIHYLRGIVSASLHGTGYGCDVESYSIFTDVRNYMTLLKNP